MEIAIPFVQIEALNPNIDNSSSIDSSEIYFNCILVCFASLRKFEPTAKLVLYTNLNPPIDVTSDLTKLSVEIRICPYTFIPSEAFGNKFKGCFYLFDAIHNCNSSTLFIDPDVIAIDQITDIEISLGNHYGIFVLNFSNLENINGLTIDDAARIYSKYCEEVGEPHHPFSRGHLGGEAIFIPKQELEDLSIRISKFWSWNVAAANRGDDFLTTEEHVLTNILKMDKYELLNPFISRIWTSKRFTKHQGNEGNIFELKLWHLPAEKTRGFISMHKLLSSQSFAILMKRENFMHMAKRIMNIDKPANLVFSSIYFKYQSFLNLFQN